MKPDNSPECTGKFVSEREQAFFDLAKRFRNAQTLDEVTQLGDELGRFIFGH